MIKFSIRHLLLGFVIRISLDQDDDENARLQKEILIVTTLIITAAGIVWGSVYLRYDEPVAAFIPYLYSVLSAGNIVLLWVFRHYRLFRFIQLLLILLLPFFLHLSLGGFFNGSAVIIWSLLGPLGALMCCKSPQSFYWFGAYAGLLIVSGFVQPFLRLENNLPDEFIRFFVVVNIGAVSAIAFAVLNYFVKQKDRALKLIRKHRELEKAYVQQEVMLRQNEKLATLGKLSAGIAHELNNPAAAVHRNVEQLRDTITKLENTDHRLRQEPFSVAQLAILETYIKRIRERVEQPIVLDPVDRSDREDDVEEWLTLKSVRDAGTFAPMLVDLGFDRKELTGMAENFSGENFSLVAGYLCNLYSSHHILDQTEKGISRITDIVGALRSYSYLDQAPVQSVDIHEGINNTLVMMQNKLKNGIQVRREYTEDFPRIEAYGSELNQVWTNIIDNAVDALHGGGEIIIRTFKEDTWGVVEIKDNGPGIPADFLPKVFDPFVTTKPPGEGTGLGLNISHNIVVQKHNGLITVKSKPGETIFIVKLPIS
jgi:signal transduction histidine kinase